MMTQENPYDLKGQKRREKDRRTAEKAERSAYLIDLRDVMQTPQGRRVLKGLLSRTHVFAVSLSGDVAATAFREGERNVGLSLMSDMREADAEILGALLLENLKGAKE